MATIAFFIDRLWIMENGMGIWDNSVIVCLVGGGGEKSTMILSEREAVMITLKYD